ncbi:hypothetical protein LCGC14_1536950 [marine sediment metagenome]|uniref:Uncharacterized protein n=1 Tax=marine sediment metagenome TaxID=412755 RepID=A0A0F9IU85_9ZZZZ
MDTLMDDFELTQRLEQIEKALDRLLEIAGSQPIDRMDSWTKEYPPLPALPWDPQPHIPNWREGRTFSG